MQARRPLSIPRWMPILVFMWGILIGPRTSWSQTNLKDTALDLIPADAGFASLHLRTGEQWQALMSSRAAATLKRNPFIQIGWAQLRQAWEQPVNESVRRFKEALRVPENQKLLTLLRQGVSREWFLYGDESVGDLALVLNSLNGRIQSAQFAAREQGEDPGFAIVEEMMRTAVQHADVLNVPRLVIGLRTDDEGEASRQLGRLAELLDRVGERVPLLAGRAHRHTVHGTDLVTLTLDGSMIPWDQAEEGFPGDTELFEQVKQRWMQKTVAISVGVRGPFLLFSIGPNDEHFLRFGSQPSLLTRDELRPVHAAAERPLTEVGYASASLLKKLSNMEVQIQSFQANVRVMLAAMEFDEALQERIIDRMSSAFAKLMEMVPEPGAVTTYKFMTPRGYEAFTYQWGEQPALDDSRPLKILQHVGGSPTVLAALSRRRRPGEYAAFREFIKSLAELGDEIASTHLTGDQKAKYEQLRDRLRPLARQLDRANREFIGPALADGQSAVVIDFKMRSAQPQHFLPAAHPALPIPEVALVCSVSDREKLGKGIREYFSVLREGLDAVRVVVPDALPPVHIPSPERSQGEYGDLFTYTLPPILGLDERIAVTGGLSDDTAVIALSSETVERMLKATPLDAGGLLNDPQRNQAAATRFDFAGLVDAVTPWLRYGFAYNLDREATTVDYEHAVLPFDDFLRVLRCYKGTTSTTYRDGEAWVTHAETIIEDLPESDTDE